MALCAAHVLMACGPEDATPPPVVIDAGVPDAAREPDAAPPPLPDPSITPGAPDRLLLRGMIVTPDVAFAGAVLVEKDTITCVDAADACDKEPGAVGATIIDTQGIIAPGFVDTHNHILFDIFDGDDWLPSMSYQNHDQWTLEPRYQAMLDVKQCLANDSQGKPAWCATTPYGTPAGSLRCEMDKWGELKGLIAGTTSIVGLPGTSSACFGSLSRSIDAAQNDLGADSIQTSAIFPPSTSAADAVCANTASMQTKAYVIHCGEGTDERSRNEFATLGSVSTVDECLYAATTVITHGTAFGDAEFQTMADRGMKLTWSPASNFALYGAGATTNIPSARAKGVQVSLSPDWSMGGSRNLLDELRVADAHDNAAWSDSMSPKDLVQMVTANPAVALGLGDRLGHIKTSALADLVVLAGDMNKPFDAILAASPRTVRLTMVGGKILYGDEAFRAAAPEKPGCETLDVCGRQKFLCVAEDETRDKLGQTYAQIKEALEKALVDADNATPDDGWNVAPLTPLFSCD
jgi:5-methylthioadenosine/S-adenosylhomocysteine deaminase